MAGVPAPQGVLGLDLARETPPEDRTILVEDADNIDPALIRLALYRGQWKLVREGRGAERRYRLCDLRADPVGELDVSAQHPEIQAALVAEMEALWNGLDERLEGQQVALGAQADVLKGLGYVSDD